MGCGMSVQKLPEGTDVAKLCEALAASKDAYDVRTVYGPFGPVEYKFTRFSVTSHKDGVTVYLDDAYPIADYDAAAKAG